MESISRLEKAALEIFQHGLAAADPKTSIKRHVSLRDNILSVNRKPYSLENFEHVYVVGFGKAAASMASALEDILEDWLTDGLVVVKYQHTAPLRKIKLIEAGHPVPDERSLYAARSVLDFLARCTDRDLVLCVISGGASALLTHPVPSVNLEDLRELTEQLLASGADIYEINTLRKHLSMVKGGQLARAAHPATVISLILSDVIGDDISTIASGPTAPDPTSFADCAAIIQKYHLNPPPSIREYIVAGLRGEAPETPKPGDAIFEKIDNIIVGNNYQAIKAAAERARELGFNTLILSTQIEGDTREAAGFHVAILKEVLHSGNPVAPPACILSGGETTVKLKGDGLGGRNQEFTLYAAKLIEGMEDVAVLSCGSDGSDGPTDAAGAIATGNTVREGEELGVKVDEYLENNDSYNFFKAIGGLVKTGPTNTNVMDLRILLAGGK
jgi:hydroxypyruvate reductase